MLILDKSTYYTILPYFFSLEPLPIALACINISPHGRKWLVDNVYDRDVWFRLLYCDRTSSPPVLYTDVQLPKVRSLHITKTRPCNIQRFFKL